MDPSGKKIAIINDELYRVGDMNEDYEFTVKSISEEMVIITIRGDDYTLYLYEYEGG